MRLEVEVQGDCFARRKESIADLAGKKDVLAGLGHGAVRGIHDKDPAVHLRCESTSPRQHPLTFPATQSVPSCPDPAPAFCCLY